MFFLSIQKNMFRQNDSFGLKFSGQSKKWVEIVNRIGYLHKSTLDYSSRFLTNHTMVNSKLSKGGLKLLIMFLAACIGIWQMIKTRWKPSLSRKRTGARFVFRRR